MAFLCESEEPVFSENGTRLIGISFSYHLHPLPLTPDPHIQPISVKHLGFDDLSALWQLRHHPGGGQAVENGLDVGAGVLELDAPQLAAVHKLDALAHLALLEAVFIGHGEAVGRHGEPLDAVHTVDGGGFVGGVGEVLLLVDALDEGGQVKIVLAEQDAHRLHPAVFGRAVVGANIVHLENLVVPDGLAELPQLVHELFAVVGRHIVEPLVADQLLHGLQVLGRRAAGHQLVQNRVQLRLHKRAALEQNLAHG